MNRTATPLAGPPGPLALLDAEIARLEARLAVVRSARSLMLELAGPAATPTAPVAGRPIPAPPADAHARGVEANRERSEAARAANRLAIARVLLERGPLPAGVLFRCFTGRGHSWIAKTCNAGADWFAKVGERTGGGADTRPWGLTERGREEASALIAAEGGKRPAARKRGRPKAKPRQPPPADEPADGPADDRGLTPQVPDARPNPILDAEFEDLFIPEARGGKPTPRPFQLNGSGAHHRNGTATMEPSASRTEQPSQTEPAWVLVLRLLAQGPRTYAELTSSLPTHPATTGKAVQQLAARGLVRKSGGKMLRGRWSITDAGREELASR